MRMKNRNKTAIGGAKLAVGWILMAAAVAVSIVAGLFLSPSVPTEYEPTVLKYAEMYNVPPALIFSVINTESSFNKDAVSSAGARGLMQITPETFEWLQTKTGESLDNDKLFDPEVSIKYGTFFLSILLERFEVVDTAVAAYNAGMNAVSDWLKDPRYSDDGKNLKEIPYSETSYYVVKINRSLESYQKLYK